MLGREDKGARRQRMRARRKAKAGGRKVEQEWKSQHPTNLFKLPASLCSYLHVDEGIRKRPLVENVKPLCHLSILASRRRG
jgi:hypothetical protein